MNARTRQRGVAALEMALVLPLLLMIALGAFEYGMLFREWLSVTTATREGARVAATAGDHSNADCLILEATAGALKALDTSSIKEVWIYESNEDGHVPPAAASQVYRPPKEDDVDLVACETNSWVLEHDGWNPDERDNDGPERDWVGVRVVFRHNWVTGFLWWSGEAEFTDDVVLHMEPNYDF